MKTLILLILLCQLSYGATISEWKDAVVKVKSFPCDTKAPVFLGTGVLVNNNNQIGILSSDHIFYQSKSKKVCIDIENSKINMSLDGSSKIDFINGLAWFRVNESKLNKLAIKISDLNATSVNADISILGYPLNLNTLQHFDKGTLVASESKRAIIPALSSIYEVEGLSVEPGMSGGPLLVKNDSGSYVFAGLVSHRAETTTDNIIDKSWLTLAIPKKHIINWLNNSLYEDLIWKRNATKGGSQLSYDKLNLTAKDHNIDHFALGGADGSGVGGDGKDDGAKKRQMVELSLDRGEVINQSVFEKYPLLKKWSGYLLKGSKVYILQMAKKVGDTYKVKSVANLEQVMTLWLRDEYQPVVYIEGFSSGGVKSNLQKRLQIATQLDEQLKYFIENTDKKSKLNRWFVSLNQLSLLYANFVASGDDLGSYSHAYAGDNWQKIYTLDFDKAVQLEQTLLELMLLK